MKKARDQRREQLLPIELSRKSYSDLCCRSRTSMRLAGEQTRLLVADELPSMLDPESEHTLFSQLGESCGKKTLVL